jgi:putative DNA primase/helicase
MFGNGTDALTPPRFYSTTDCGNAERLVDGHGESLRFCRGLRQWYVWDGRVWSPDDGAAIQLAKKTVRSMQQERKQLMTWTEDQPLQAGLANRWADSLDRWAARSEGASRIMAMLRMAESDPRVAIEPHKFDDDPLILTVLNGSIDLKTGQFQKQRPEDMVSKLAGCEYRPTAKCPRWHEFMKEVFYPHPEMIPFVQRAAGYSLTGDTREECVFVLEGTGRNGKGTLIGTLHRVFGQYGGVAEMDTFMVSRGSPLREDIADMRGRRFVSSQEPMLDGKFAEATLKWLSGGDLLRARRLFEHAQEFQPSHKLWLAVNRLPQLPRDDPASWSRLRIIPFDVSFEVHPNRNLKTELQSELSGILNWALEGCLSWQTLGLGSTANVVRPTHSSRSHAGASI